MPGRGDHHPAVASGLAEPQTIYAWDGRRALTIQGEPWWRVESEHREWIAFVLLFHRTDDRELAEARAKAFALEVLGPLAAHAPATILASAVDAWLLAHPSRPAPTWRPAPRALVIPCASCRTPIPVAARHFGLLEVFGTLCQSCRRVPA